MLLSQALLSLRQHPAPSLVMAQRISVTVQAGLKSPPDALQTLADLAGYGMACCALMVVNFVLLAWPGVRPTTDLQLRRLCTLPVRVIRLLPPHVCANMLPANLLALQSPVGLAAHSGECAASSVTLPLCWAPACTVRAYRQAPGKAASCISVMPGCAMPPCRHFTGSLSRRRCTQLQSWGP